MLWAIYENRSSLRNGYLDFENQEEENMIKRLTTSTVMVFAAFSSLALAQNTNSSQTIRPRTAATSSNTNKSTTSQKSADSHKSTDVQQPTTTPPRVRHTEVKPRVAETPASQSVVAAFNELINGIRHADAKAVTNVYLNSPRLILFNSNGTVVSCLWTQSQTYKGAPETATGRMTLVFKRVGRDWKAIHLHTSPDRPEPARVLPSEQVPGTTPP